ncbi:MAG TPA: hypothetical protein VF169_26160 [Albitalea sp.]|uniref:hypothetical protein n=1 Tax=Piscinibacter sp. TaxID=1903157 RepID=UPI002ED3C5C4
MPSIRVHSLLAALGLAVIGNAALAATPLVKAVEAKPLPAVQAPALARGAVLTDLGSAFIEGDRIGSVHAGTNCNASVERGWSELIRQRVDAEISQAFRDELGRTQSFRTAPAGMGAPLTVQAFLNDMDVEVCGAGAGAWKGGFYVQVGWQIVSPEGKVIYRASTEGSFLQPSAQRVSTASGLRQAVGVAVRNLLADRRFTALLEEQGSQRRVALADPI